jgi:Fic family protein
MKRLEKPPEWTEILKAAGDDVFGLLNDREVARFIGRINDQYLYWDECRHKPRPGKLTAGAGWGLVKISRLSQMKYGNLLSTDGRPFGYWLPDPVLRELHFIDQNATGQLLVDEPGIGAADRERYVISSLMEEAIASSLLEGAATTRKRAKDMLREGRPPKTRGELMIQNNYATMAMIKDRLADRMSVEFLCELQASMTGGTLDDPTAAGRLRTADELVQVVDMTDGTVLHTPPPADGLKKRLQLLCDFANEESDIGFIHPVIKGILLHFWLAYEHPFVDGNGRTARAIFYWYLLRKKYWLIEFLPISRIILKAPSKYKMAFYHSEIDQEDLTYFIIFNLRALHLSIEDLRKYLIRKQGELREAGKLAHALPGLNQRQQELINHALRHPDAAYTIARHARIHGIVYQTSRTDLLNLVKMRLFTQERSGRLFKFRASGGLGSLVKSGKRSV